MKFNIVNPGSDDVLDLLQKTLNAEALRLSKKAGLPDGLNGYERQGIKILAEAQGIVSKQQEERKKNPNLLDNIPKEKIIEELEKNLA
jgi:hypothetical protein